MAYTHKTKVGRFTVTDGGLCGPLRRMKDGTCILSADQLGELERRAAITVLKSADPITGEELKFARKVLGLRQTELGDFLGVGSETVSRWENGREDFKPSVQLAVLELLEQAHRGEALTRPKLNSEADFVLQVPAELGAVRAA